MKYRLLIVGLLLLAVQSLRAQPASAPASQPTKSWWEPKQASQFFQKITVEDYSRVGTRSSKWDSDAHAALESLAVVLECQERAEAGDAYDIIYARSKRLNEAGCSDPLALYARARAAAFFGKKLDDITPLHVEAAKRIAESAYHPLLKTVVCLRGAALRARDRSDPRASRRDGRRMVEAALDAMPRALADPDVPIEAVLDLYDLVGDASLIVERDRSVVFEKAMDLLKRSPLADRPGLVQTVQAEFSLNFALDARRDTAGAGQEQADKLTRDRLAQAATAAQQAWEADPAHAARAADLMMQIEHARAGKRDVINTWFARGVEADPRRLATYLTRLRLLEPPAGGSIREMIEFARETFRSHGRASDSVSLLPVEAHLRAAEFTAAGVEQDLPQRSYFMSDSEVWNDIRAAYEPYLSRHPGSLYHRSRFGQLAAWCGQWEVADQQLKAMGDQRFSAAWFRTRESYLKQRAEVADHLAAK